MLSQALLIVMAVIDSIAILICLLAVIGGIAWGLLLLASAWERD